MAVKLM